MEIDWGFEVLDQLEAHWHGRLRPRLRGLTDEEYCWQPVADCWGLSRGPSGEVTMDGVSGDRQAEQVTTIAWRLGHVIVGLAETSARHLGGPPAELSTFPFAGTAAGALAQLDEEHDVWVAGVRGLGPEGLARPQGPTSGPAFADAPLARLVMYVHMEVIHHLAEVCLLRDLYERRSELAASAYRA